MMSSTCPYCNQLIPYGHPVGMNVNDINKLSNIELGMKLLEFLREIHERDETPESCDVDGLLSMFSLYSK